MDQNEQLNEVAVLLGLKDADDIPTSKCKVARLELELEIKPLSPKAANEFREEMESLEDMEQNALLIARSCIKPNFNNPELLKQAECTFGWQFIMRKFLPGEISQVYKFINTISGFGENSVTEIKNC